MKRTSSGKVDWQEELSSECDQLEELVKILLDVLISKAGPDPKARATSVTLHGGARYCAAQIKDFKIYGTGATRLDCKRSALKQFREKLEAAIASSSWSKL